MSWITGNAGLAGIAIGAALLGQIVTASLDGTVLDPTGAAAPNANVRIVHNSTNLDAIHFGWKFLY